jgi:hypothetical protein
MLCGVEQRIMQQGCVCRNGILSPPPNSIAVSNCTETPEMIASQAARKSIIMQMTADPHRDGNLGTRLPSSIASGII